MKHQFKLLLCSILLLFVLGGFSPLQAADSSSQPKWEQIEGVRKHARYSEFPKPVDVYDAQEKSQQLSIGQKILHRMQADKFNLAATLIFLLAIIHTFVAPKFAAMAHKLEHEEHAAHAASGEKHGEHPPHSLKVSILHFLGEIEAVFGLWIIPLMFVASYFYSFSDFVLFVEKDCKFIEPLFVVVIMIIAASRPVVRSAELMMAQFAKLGKSTPAAWWLSVMTLGPILGSFITEPAAMTICALLLARRLYAYKPSKKLAYGSLGLLFVNISIGGTLTNFAAPPVVMVAGKDAWNWDMSFMFFNFGWKAVVSILIGNVLYFAMMYKELRALGGDQAEQDADVPVKWEDRKNPVPLWVTLASMAFLVWTVYFAHNPVMFVGGFLFFLGFSIATQEHQNQINIRIPLMVGFFLAALVIHGSLQTWWLEPILTGISSQVAMISATLLTAINDNAAITFLASTVPNLSDATKYAIVAGAVTGGGLTVIANAPNPAGQSILGKFFAGGINPLGLLLGALIPTVIAYVCFIVLP